MKISESNKRVITDDLIETIASYMDDEIREDLHCKLAKANPTESDNIEFLNAYLARDEEFGELLERDFEIKIDD